MCELRFQTEPQDKCENLTSDLTIESVIIRSMGTIPFILPHVRNATNFAAERNAVGEGLQRRRKVSRRRDIRDQFGLEGRTGDAGASQWR